MPETAPSRLPSSTGWILMIAAGFTGTATLIPCAVLAGIQTHSADLINRIGAPSSPVTISWRIGAGGGLFLGREISPLVVRLVLCFDLEREGGGGLNWFSPTFAIKSWVWREGVCTSCANWGVRNGLKLLCLRKFTPNIIGRDKFSNTTAWPLNIILILLNLSCILTSPNVVIVALSVAPLANFKFDYFNLLRSPPR